MKALVVGAGAISRQHLGCLKQIPAVTEVHVCDLSAVTARAMADRFVLDGWSTDFTAALAAIRPDVVHVATPPSSHRAIATEALESGAHVIVEKPATLVPSELVDLVELAGRLGLMLVEDYNYIFNPGVQAALRDLRSGEYGDLVHVDVEIALDIFGEGSTYLDPALNRSFTLMKGGPIADFLPHLASLAHAFVGSHSEAHSVWTQEDPEQAFPDGLRALVAGEHGTASVAFSARAQPDLFLLRIEGTRQRSHFNIFEGRGSSERQLETARPLIPLLNGLREGRDVGLGSLQALSRKLSGGPGAYQGLWTLVEQVYAAAGSGGPPPVTPGQMLEVTALVDALTEGRTTS